MGNIDRSRLAKELEPYLASQIRSMLNAALTKSSLPTLNVSGGGGLTPPAPLTTHVLATATALGTYHTIAGATAGHVLRATASNAAAFAQLLHGDLGNVQPDDHHNQSHAHNSSDHTGLLAWATVDKTGSSLGDLATRNYLQLNSRTHDIVGGDHSYTGGAALDVFGLSAANTLAKLTPSADVSAGVAALLRSDAAGLLKLRNLNVNGALQSDSANFAIGVNVAPDGGAALDIRAGAISDHSQRIKQISGQTGRLWRIENTSGQELIVLDSVGNLQSGNPGFVSGLTGWQVTPAGNAEFNNGRFRGELHATVMVFDEVSVRNGTELITPAGGALELDVTIVSTGTPAIRNVRTTAFGDQDFLDYRTDSVTGSGDMTARTVENILSVKNPDTGHYQVFRSGEVLRMKAWTGSAVTDTWMRINSAVDMGTYYAYFVEIMSGSLPVTYRAGSAAAGYGKPGEGAIRLSADDPYGPLIDIFTTGAQPWAADVYPHVRLGRLDGVGVPGLSGIRQYGIALGTNLADATLPYMFASNLGVRQYNIDSAWNDGANDTVRIEAGGRARFGTNVDTALGTFLDINPAAGLATFRGAIEVLAGSSGYGNLTDKPTLGTMAAIDNSLDNVNNGSTYARVNSTIISGGNIRVGSGTKDSTLNGWNIDSGEIVGQASGVDQVVMGTDGAISAGAGNVNLDASGIWVEAPIDATATVSSYRFKDEVYGYEIGGIYGLSAFSTVPLKAHNILIEALATGTTGGDIRIEANAAALGGGNIQLVGNVDCESIANIRTTSSAW